jgi:hypothetical protein
MQPPTMVATVPRHVPSDYFTDAAFRFDDPLGSEPFPNEPVLHSLAHFSVNSHI